MGQANLNVTALAGYIGWMSDFLVVDDDESSYVTYLSVYR